MKLKELALAAGIVFAASAANAGITTYDFDGFLDGTDISGIDLGGVTLSGGPIIVSGGAVSSGGTVTGTFSMFGVINVALDVDGLTTLTSLGFGDTELGSDSGSAGTLSVFHPNQLSITIESAGTFDNLTVNSIDVSGGEGGGGPLAAPVPAALPLMATALAGVAYLGTRRRK